MKLTLALVSCLLMAAPGNKAAPGAKDEPERIAKAYLKAIEGTGKEEARDYLLGGVTLDAELCTIPNWRIVNREPVKVEEADLATAIREMKALDTVGRKTLDKILKSPEGESFQTLSRAQAEKIMKPTQDQAKKFKKQFPLFAYMARVDREVYWHPKNPWRALLSSLGKSGKYRLEFHKFNIEELERRGKKRVWPLRVLRITTPSYDSGWKILPASDWDPET